MLLATDWISVLLTSERLMTLGSTGTQLRPPSLEPFSSLLQWCSGVFGGSWIRPPRRHPLGKLTTVGLPPERILVERWNIYLGVWKYTQGYLAPRPSVGISGASGHKCRGDFVPSCLFSDWFETLKHLFPQRRIQPLYLNLYNIAFKINISRLYLQVMVPLKPTLLGLNLLFEL